MSYLLKSEIYEQIFEFFYFILSKFKEELKKEDKIKQYLIEEIIQNNNFEFLNKIFIQYHFYKHDILKIKNNYSRIFPSFKDMNHESKKNIFNSLRKTDYNKLVNDFFDQEDFSTGTIKYINMQFFDRIQFFFILLLIYIY